MRLRSLLCSAAALVALAAIAPPAARAAVVNVTPATFRDALAAAQDGDTLVLRSGVYKGTFSRSDISGLTIRGRGRVIFQNDPDNEDTGTILEFTNANGLTIERLTIRNSSNDRIHLYFCSNFVARKLRIDNCSDSGIEDRNTNGYLVEKCRFTNCSWGLALGYGGAATGVTVRGNRFAKMGSYGIDVKASDALIERNAVAGGEGTGIKTRNDQSNVTFNRNVISRMGEDGILVPGSGHTVTANKVSRCTGSGIVLDASGTGPGAHTCTGNTSTGNASSGIRVTTTGCTISGNKARGNTPFDLQSTQPEGGNTYEMNKFGTTSFDTGSF